MNLFLYISARSEVWALRSWASSVAPSASCAASCSTLKRQHSSTWRPGATSSFSSGYCRTTTERIRYTVIAIILRCLSSWHDVRNLWTFAVLMWDIYWCTLAILTEIDLMPSRHDALICRRRIRVPCSHVYYTLQCYIISNLNVTHLLFMPLLTLCMSVKSPVIQNHMIPHYGYCFKQN